MDIGRGFLAAGNVEVAPARRAGADEDRVPALGQQRFEAVDARAAAEFDAEIEDVVAFLVDDALGQAEARDLGADHAAGFRILVDHHAVVAEWRQIARHRQRGGAAAHQRDALPILDGSRLGQAVADVVLEVGCYALEAADRHRLFLHASAPAGRFARPVARAPEDSGKHVGLPVDHVGVAVAPGRDQTDVFGDGCVCRTGPLTIHDLVEVVRRRNVGRFHLLLCTHACRAPLENHARSSVGRPSSNVRLVVRQFRRG